MAGKSKLELAVDSGKWDAGIKKAMQSLNNFIDNAGSMSGALEKNSGAMTKYVSMLGDLTSASTTPRTAMRDLTNAIAELTIKYNQLSDEDKSSAFGKAMSASISQLKQRAGDLKDMIGDINEELTNIASDTQFTDGVNLMASTVGNCASAMVAWAGDSEDLKEVLMDLAKIQTTIQAVEQLTKAFQKQNMVLLKNPYVLLTTAAVALAAAMATIIKKQTEMSATQKAVNDAIREGASKAQEEITKVKLLNERLHDNATSLEERKTALKELQALVPDYHGALTEEGRLINDNSDAIMTYVDRLEKAAIAQAAFDKMVEQQKELLDIDLELKKAEKDLAATKARQSTTPAGPVTSSGGYAPGASYAQMGAAGEAAGLQKRIDGLKHEKHQAEETIGALKQYVHAEDIAAESVKKAAKASAEANEVKNKEVKALDMQSIQGMTLGGPTESMRSLKASLSYWQEALENATDYLASEQASKMIAKIQQEIDLQPIAIRVGMSTEDVSKVKSQMDNLLSDMRTNMKGLKIESGSTGLKKEADDAGKSFATAVGSVNNLGSALQSVGKTDLNVAGTIMQAIANIALGFSAQSLQAAGGGPIAWAVATVNGLATMIATIASIKKATAGSYAEGGVVPGNSYTGDKLIAHVNSGETILTQKQARAALNMIETNNNYSPGRSTISGEQIVTVVNAYGRRTGRGEILR